MTPQQIQAKITAVIQRITPRDIESEDARERFIAGLPPWLFGTAGGNTPCVELTGADGTEVILDAGSGISFMGKSAAPPKDNHYNLFFSHFHWDHIQGLPFFGPAYNPETVIDVYSAAEDAEAVLRRQMETPCFPVPFDSFTKRFAFHCVRPGQSFPLGGLSVSLCAMSHPGVSYSYSFEEGGKKFVYATDVEIAPEDFEKTPERAAVFQDADCIILDSQYTVEEAYRKTHWGHSAFCYAVDFAAHWNIRRLFLFHHEPTYNDKKLNSILLAARWYAEYIERADLSISLATENSEFEI